LAVVSLRKIEKVYPNGFKAVHGVDLEVKDGEFMVFVGPSGCAKSTLLRMVAGLESISGGELRIGDRAVNDLAPKARGIAMVFQNYALYPHMTVYENLAFGLRLSKTPRPSWTSACATPPSCWRWNSCSTATPSSSAAARPSAWRWAVPSSRSPRCFCSTSRSPTSTPSCAPPCACA
jgi:ABC-type sugar transport system ATPase subunit